MNAEPGLGKYSYGFDISALIASLSALETCPTTTMYQYILNCSIPSGLERFPKPLLSMLIATSLIQPQAAARNDGLGHSSGLKSIRDVETPLSIA